MNFGTAYKTGLALTLILSLLGTKTAYARWAGLLQVKPEMKEESSISVKRLVSPDAKDCRLAVDNIDSGSRQAWLIRADRELSPEEQEMRNYLWDLPAGTIPSKPKQMAYPVKAPVNSIIGQAPTSMYVESIMPDAPGNEHHELILEFHSVYEITLPKTETKNAYLYIDYPSAIADGGWFYSVDLGAFCAQPDDAH